VPNSGADRTDDSNADPATGRSEIFTVAAVPGGTTVADTDPATVAVLVNPTIDAGYVPVVGAGNYTWIDTNGNGLQDAGEQVLPGVTVRLLNPDGSPALDIDGNPVPDEVTDGAGLYFFDNLAPGNYIAEFVLPVGYGFTVPRAGADTAVDSNPDRATGRTPVFTIGDAAGGETTADTDPATQAVFANLTIDAGVVPIVAVGDYTWLDANRDGVQDPGEAPLPGVTVRLLDGAGQPALDIRGNPVPPAVTGPDGRYFFDNLAPGSYQISFTGPAGYALSPPGNGTAATDTNPAPATGLTPVFTIGGSATGDTVADTDPATAAVWVNPTIDAGFFQAAALGDRVWFDNDRDGTQDPGEPGVPGVTVTLFTPAGAVVGTTTTDANGNYRFDGLPPGDYIVEFSNLPPAYGATGANRGDDGNDSDADPITLRTPIISLSAGEVDLTWDLGIVLARQLLPRTGGEIARLLVTATGAVLAGYGLWLFARRRRQSGVTS
jgi:LPXTG-motif cell wall-anchored protein